MATIPPAPAACTGPLLDGDTQNLGFLSPSETNPNISVKYFPQNAQGSVWHELSPQRMSSHQGQEPLLLVSACPVMVCEAESRAGVRLSRKSPGCSCRTTGLSSQHPQGDPQQSLTPVPGDLQPFSGPLGQGTNVVHRHAGWLNIHTHKHKTK